MNYTVIIADIVKSRNIANRKQFQNKLEKSISDASGKSKTIISPYTVTLGDEFQAVYKNPDALFRDIYSILIDIYPVKLRFSIGQGEITTRVKKDNALGMDGPAFYNARRTMEMIKKIDYSIIQLNSNNESDFFFINKNLNLMNKIMDNWKFNSLYIFNSFMHGKSIDEIAANLKISKRGVYKVADTNCIKEFVSVFNEIEIKIMNGAGCK